MSLRQKCKETSKRPSKALLYFPQEMTTGIAPTRLILGNSFEYKEGSIVTVNWEGKKIQAEIVAVDGKSYNLSIGNCSLNTKILFSNFCSSSHITCPWLQIAKRFSIRKTLSGLRSFCPPLNRALVPTNQRRSRKKAGSQGKLKSIQLFLRYLSIIFCNKAGLISAKMFFFFFAMTPVVHFKSIELRLNQSELYFTHRVDLGCILRRPGAPTFNLVLTMAGFA